MTSSQSPVFHETLLRRLLPFRHGSFPLPGTLVARKNRQWTSSIHPHGLYGKICEEGAESVSPKFLEVFQKNTDLADGKTLAYPMCEN